MITAMNIYANIIKTNTIIIAFILTHFQFCYAEKKRSDHLQSEVSSSMR